MNIEYIINGVTYDLPAPEYGYTSTLMQALHHAAQLPRGYGIWDDGTSKDVRTCSVSFLMDEADTDTMLDIWKDGDQGRGISGTLRLPNNSGFFPFGPDYGDTGLFNCRIIDLKPSPPLEEPWHWFRVTLELVMESHPAYGLPTEQDEGDLQIGTISGLRYPPTFPRPEIDYALANVITRDGSPYTIDKLRDSDKYETMFPMVLRHNKAAALVNHLVVTVRENNVTITDAGNGYLFGRSAGEGAALTCQWLDEVLSIRHERYDEFAFSVGFALTTAVE